MEHFQELIKRFPESESVFQMQVFCIQIMNRHVGFLLRRDKVRLASSCYSEAYGNWVILTRSGPGFALIGGGTKTPTLQRRLL